LAEDWREWLHEYLDRGQLAILDNVGVELDPAKSTALGEMIYAWKIHVTKLIADLSARSDDRSLWGAHDYVAALVIRDAVESGLARLDPSTRGAVLRPLLEIDSIFTDYTEHDGDGCAGRIIDKETTGRSWWWQRIPRRGPVRDEIEMYYGRESADSSDHDG
jgi:hypothetical protein